MAVIVAQEGCSGEEAIARIKPADGRTHILALTPVYRSSHGGRGIFVETSIVNGQNVLFVSVSGLSVA